MAKVNEDIIRYKAEKTECWPETVRIIGDGALEAMLMEVACLPAPGLVNRLNSGAHADMDYFTFIKSSSAISVAIYQCAMAGWQHNSRPQELLSVLRLIGAEAEKKMFLATNGINTQKGLIFLLGIVAAATAQAVRKKDEMLTSEAVLRAAAHICEGIIERELASIKLNLPDRKLTAGEQLYLKHGVVGIRGEIEGGLASVSEKGLPAFRTALAAGLSVNDALVHALLALMTVTQDTTILNRHDMDTFLAVQKAAASIMAEGGMLTDAGRGRIHKLDEIYSCQSKISPGGSADLLAITYFLDLIEKRFGEK